MVALNSISAEYKAEQKLEIVAALEKNVWRASIACGIDPADLTEDYAIPSVDDVAVPPSDLEDLLLDCITRLAGAKGAN